MTVGIMETLGSFDCWFPVALLTALETSSSASIPFFLTYSIVRRSRFKLA